MLEYVIFHGRKICSFKKYLSYGIENLIIEYFISYTIPTGLPIPNNGLSEKYNFLMPWFLFFFYLARKTSESNKI